MTEPIQEDDEVKFRLLGRMFEEGSVSWDQMKRISGFETPELEKLLGEGLVKADGSYFGSGMHYFPTPKAKKYLTDLGAKVYVPVLQRAPLKNELHDEALRNLRIGFEDMSYKVWQSERCLRQRGMVEFTPDGILELGRRKIAIELEFSGKTVEQYKKRFQFYQNHPAIDAVLYFVGPPNLREILREIMRDYPKISMVLHKNFTEYGKNAYVERPGFPGALCLWKFLGSIRKRRFV